MIKLQNNYKEMESNTRLKKSFFFGDNISKMKAYNNYILKNVKQFKFWCLWSNRQRKKWVLPVWPSLKWAVIICSSPPFEFSRIHITCTTLISLFDTLNRQGKRVSSSAKDCRAQGDSEGSTKCSCSPRTQAAERHKERDNGFNQIK